MPDLVGGSSNVAHVYRVLGVPVSIPAIQPNSAVLVTASVPGLVPGDNVEVSIAAGSTAPPPSIVIGAAFCATKDTLSIKYGYLAGALAGNSTAVNINVNVLVASAS